SAGTPGPQVRLHTPIGPGRAVQRFAFSPDGTKIAFVAAFSIPGVNEVYVVDVSNPAAPSAPVRVSAPPTINSSQVLELLWSPTSDRLAYRGSFDDVFRTDLYVSTLVGPHVRLTTAGGSNTTVYEAAWTATGTGLVYRLNDRVLSEADLYWHPIGGSPQRLSALRPGGSVFAFDLAPDGLSVTFEATQRTTSKELFWRALTGISPAVLVNPPFSVGRDIVGTEWSPVGSRFVYVADQDFPNLDEPYLVEVTSAGPGAPRRLLSSPATSQDVVVGSRSLAWSPDGRWLGFLRTDLALPNQILVIDASSPALPVASLALDQNNPALDAVSLLFAPDGGRVAVLGALMTAGVTELFVSDLRGAVPGPTLRVNPALVTGGDVTASVLGVFRADGQGLYYVADQVTDDVPEAWSVPLSPTPGAARRMHAVLSPGRSVERIYVQR
ncbi:MAG: PD40 domain-containing protein, partial [Myxococcales bacterium]|nr:PD40 domain-containing protein [Myxococcales bacterium]